MFTTSSGHNTTSTGCWTAPAGIDVALEHDRRVGLEEPGSLRSAALDERDPDRADVVAARSDRPHTDDPDDEHTARRPANRHLRSNRRRARPRPRRWRGRATTSRRCERRRRADCRPGPWPAVTPARRRTAIALGSASASIHAPGSAIHRPGAFGGHAMHASANTRGVVRRRDHVPGRGEVEQPAQRREEQRRRDQPAPAEPGPHRLIGDESIEHRQPDERQRPPPPRRQRRRQEQPRAKARRTMRSDARDDHVPACSINSAAASRPWRMHAGTPRPAEGGARHEDVRRLLGQLAFDAVDQRRDGRVRTAGTTASTGCTRTSRGWPSMALVAASSSSNRATSASSSSAANRSSPSRPADTRTSTSSPSPGSPGAPTCSTTMSTRHEQARGAGDEIAAAVERTMHDDGRKPRVTSATDAYSIRASSPAAAGATERARRSRRGPAARRRLRRVVASPRRRLRATRVAARHRGTATSRRVHRRWRPCR